MSYQVGCGATLQLPGVLHSTVGQPPASMVGGLGMKLLVIGALAGGGYLLYKKLKKGG